MYKILILKDSKVIIMLYEKRLVLVINIQHALKE